MINQHRKLNMYHSIQQRCMGKYSSWISYSSSVPRYMTHIIKYIACLPPPGLSKTDASGRWIVLQLASWLDYLNALLEYLYCEGARLCSLFDNDERTAILKVCHQLRLCALTAVPPTNTVVLHTFTWSIIKYVIKIWCGSLKLDVHGDGK